MEITSNLRDTPLGASVFQEPLASDQPHQRLAALGAHNLSHTELITLLLELAADKEDNAQASELSRELLSKVRSLRVLARCDLSELATIPGLSTLQASLLVVAFELGRRVARETVARVKVLMPETVFQLVAPDFARLNRESLRVLLLNTKRELLRIEEISLGSLDWVGAHPRDVFRPAITHHAHSIILTHNHPSGDPTPSDADRKFTDRMAAAGENLGVDVADHIIIGSFDAGEPAYFSFKEERLV